MNKATQSIRSVANLTAAANDKANLGNKVVIESSPTFYYLHR
ncbi:hypothetical protein [Metabacillus halosaccharovorans]|nr:hypothetical protein [Metabacillus halosaccharovorans]